MIVVRTPFRLPLGGGGTDLPSYYTKHKGFLITSAINKYMYINLNIPAIVNKITLHYSKTEIVDVGNINFIQHEIVRESFRYLEIDEPLEIGSMADLSAGTGMGSSSSYAVGIIRALNAMRRRYISTQELAEEACKVEIDLMGKPIGKQDQYAAAFGGIVVLEIDRSGNVSVTPLDIHPETVFELEHRLMMFYTNIERNANEILAEQSKKAKVDEEEVIRSMHRIKEIGKEIRLCLERDDITTFGKMMNEHWLEKKRISTKMTNTNIDRWYDIAMKNGALGGKVMGAGGGGFLLFCVDNGNRKNLRNILEAEGLRYMDFRFDWEGSKVLVNI
jgi:D-glycero-alpha-D-manno-heptose-7-phosphate kinase